MLDQVKMFLDELRSLRKEVKAERVAQIARRRIREKAERLGSQWCADLSGMLPQTVGIAPEIFEKYTKGCTRLIVLSSPNNLKTSYIETLDELIKPFRRELILPLQQAPSVTGSLALLRQILDALPDPEENDYLKEASSCAQRGFFRAGVVLGWCAAIDRIQRRIEQLGFANFNLSSVQNAGQQKGRVKRFSSPQNVNSLSELREVFDAVVLWVIEGMGMIDSNQHTRLSSCFEMRCQCAHPGDANVTEFNLMSFFSDINQIVFQNPMFKL